MTLSNQTRCPNRHVQAVVLLMTVALSACSFSFQSLRIPDCDRIEPELTGDWSQDLIGTWWSNATAPQGVLLGTDGGPFFVFEADGTGQFHAYRAEPGSSSDHGTFTWNVDRDQILTINDNNPTTLTWRNDGPGDPLLLLESVDPEHDGAFHFLGACEPIGNYPD